MTDRTTTPRLLHEWFVEDFAPNGYRAGRPPWIAPAAEEIDRAVAEDNPCDACGGACRYWPVHNPDTRSYRAFARCDACGNLSEF